MDSMLGTTLREIGGPFSDFHQKLAGPHGEEWWEAFKQFLRKEDPWPVVWRQTRKTIALGTGLKTADEFRRALKNSGVHITDFDRRWSLYLQTKRRPKQLSDTDKHVLS